jgi:NAD+ kinase
MGSLCFIVRVGCIIVIFITGRAIVPIAGVIYNEIKPTACRMAKDIQDRLGALGWDVRLSTGKRGIIGYAHPSPTASYTPIESLVPPDFEPGMEFAVVLGGDGTVLAAFRQVGPMGVPLLTVNTGHMGFLTEVYLSQLNDALDRVVAKQYHLEERAMLTVQVTNQGTLLWEALCLNEIVLHREPLTSMCHFEIEVGRHAPVDIAADGIIVSTPTGSTAYALSAGGPVLAPGVDALQLVPICPHSLASRALVFSDRETVTIASANRGNRLVLIVDGNGGCYVQPDYRVTISRSDYPAKFVRLQPPEYFKILREKLGWGLPHIAKPSSVELP